MNTDLVDTNFSKEQNAFLDTALSSSKSIVLEAVAGSGKTTTILEAAQRLIRTKGKSVAICAYNKKIATEIAEKLKRRGLEWKSAQSGTVHSFGFSAYRGQFPNVKVNNFKVSDIWDRLVTDMVIDDDMIAYKSPILNMVSLAKQRAIGSVTSLENKAEWFDIIDHFDVLSDVQDGAPPVSTDRIVDAGIDLLRRSNRQTEVIDFDDMVYLPVVYRVRFWTKDIVIVDEAQDTNPARRALVRAMVAKGGRVIAVGDRHQAIYGFTGADNDSLDLIAKDFDAIRMPLSTTFRCPKNIVAFAQQWVSHIHAADTAAEGKISSTNPDEFMKRNDLTKDSAVLCRNTAPLVELAFKLIRSRIACRVEGRMDIGAGLKQLATRWTRVKTINALEGKLDEYLGREKVKLLAMKAEARLQLLEDKVSTLKVIMDECRKEKKDQVQDIINFIDSIFADNIEDVMVLSTIHKSKGREWKNVFWYDRANTCPSKWARQAWEKAQETNLMYVCATRAMEELIEIVV